MLDGVHALDSELEIEKLRHNFKHGVDRIVESRHHKKEAEVHHEL